MIIEPGVEVIIMGHYEIFSMGHLLANGTPNNRIIFKSNDTTGLYDPSSTNGGWKGIRQIDPGGPYLYPAPTYSYCDIKHSKGINALVTGLEKLVISNCNFTNNFVTGAVLSAGNSKIKINSSIFEHNSGNTVTYLTSTDSCFFLNNRFDDNLTEGGIANISNSSNEDSGYILASNNEFYNNTIRVAGSCLRVSQGGKVNVINNSLYKNSLTSHAAVSIYANEGLIERNLIANNSREEKNGYVCGTNEGGAGLMLHGGNILFNNEPDKYNYIVRNNLIANNYSDINGAGIWANYCKASIFHNTIINNQSRNFGAGISTAGIYARFDIQHNIIHGNLSQDWDPGRTAIQFNNGTDSTIFANNLLQFNVTHLPNSVIGSATNIIDSNITLENPTAGPGINFDATLANFSPSVNSLHIIDVSNPNHVDVGSVDFNDNNRLVGVGVDRGAIEYQTDLSTGIGKISREAKVRVYPNPARELLQLEVEHKIEAMRAIDPQGRPHNLSTKESTPLTYSVNVESLKPGNYFLEIHFNNGTFRTVTITRL